VSYRRDDSQRSAGRINDRLEAVFGAGRVFFDTVTIKPGEDFHAVLGNSVGSCRVLLAVIGPRWLDILVSQLSETNDFVRIEIAEALQRKVRVIPVLIDGAKPPPAAQLPDDLRPWRASTRCRSGRRHFGPIWSS
jgi:TIR domain